MTEIAGYTPRSRKLWGPETPAGERVLAQIAAEKRKASEPAASVAEQPSQKRRRSRWAPSNALVKVSVPGIPGVELPRNVAALVQSADKVTLQLKHELIKVTQTLHLISNGTWADVTPESERSPSPEPVYDASGMRSNTRAARAHDKLNSRRNELIAELIRTCPSFEPPADWRPPKKSAKLYIPQHEHPSFNFIGLIIGPRGRTQQDMESQTGAKIVIRGRGSVKDGHVRGAPRSGDAESEPLHVLVTADTQEAVDAAVALVQPLLTPSDTSTEEHKRSQLRQLAEIRGTSVRDHSRDADPLAHGGDVALAATLPGDASERDQDVYRLPEAAAAAAAEQYARDLVAKHGEQAAKEETFQDFVRGLGGAVPGQQDAHGAPGSVPAAASAGPKLYVGNLPFETDEVPLRALFSQYGAVYECSVVRDRMSRASKGFAFVGMTTEAAAAAAMTALDGFVLGGNRLRVSPKGADRRHDPSAGLWDASVHSSMHGYPPPDDAPPGVSVRDLPDHVFAPPAVAPAWDVPYPTHPGYHTTQAPVEPAALPPLAAVPLPAAAGVDAYDDLPPGAEDEMRAALAHEHASSNAAVSGVHADALGVGRSAQDGTAAGKAAVASDQDAPMHIAPVGVSEEERRKAEQREAAKEARRQAEEQRRARLLEAAAAAVKQSAPLPPPPPAARPPRPTARQASRGVPAARDGGAAPASDGAGSGPLAKPDEPKAPKVPAQEPSESGEIVESSDEDGAEAESSKFGFVSRQHGGLQRNGSAPWDRRGPRGGPYAGKRDSWDGGGGWGRDGGWRGGSR